MWSCAGAGVHVHSSEPSVISRSRGSSPCLAGRSLSRGANQEDVLTGWFSQRPRGGSSLGGAVGSLGRDYGVTFT